MKLWRAANDDYVDTGYSFAEKRSTAEAYLDNPGFGGANIYRADVEIDDDQVLDFTGKSMDEVAEELGVQHPGAIGVDEWIPRSPKIMDALREAGALWVKVDESFPPDTVTWIWVGTGLDDEPELELAAQKGSSRS